MSAELAFQTALLAQIAADADVQAHLGNPARVYDRAPGGAVFPFLACGRGDSEPADADAVSLIDHRLTLHLWMRRGEQAELKRVLGAVRAAIHDSPPDLAPGHACIRCQVVYADLFQGSDGRTLHGLLRVRAMLEALA